MCMTVRRASLDDSAWTVTLRPLPRTIARLPTLQGDCLNPALHSLTRFRERSFSVFSIPQIENGHSLGFQMREIGILMRSTRSSGNVTSVQTSPRVTRRDRADCR